VRSIPEILSGFESVQLEQLDAVKLLNRVDTKFLLHVSSLPSLLDALSKGYYVLEIKEQRMSHYDTVYYDTRDFFYYYVHQTGRLPRTKIRIRTYMETGQSFLEIKVKNNHKKTAKDRILIESAEILADKKSRKFLKQKVERYKDIVPVIKVLYSRTTLVNKDFSERLTIDTGLKFMNGGQVADFADLCIIELKQDKSSKSFIREVLREHRIFESSLSKYCLGVATLYPEVKKNNIKQKIREIKKLCHENI
jgi:hypothetical protein